MVFLKHEQTGMSLEKCVDELQKDFESAMETVVTAIRAKHGVTEQQMTQVMVHYQTVGDVEVQTAVTTLREVRAATGPQRVPGGSARACMHMHMCMPCAYACAGGGPSALVRPVPQAMSGKAPAKQTQPESAKPKPARRAKPRQKKG